MGKTPVLLMVSGGSDSMALLELAVEYVDLQAARNAFLTEESGAAFAQGDGGDESVLLGMVADALPAPGECALHVLHVNHLLRGDASDGDEAFVVSRCGELGVSCECARVDIAGLVEQRKGGLEAIAREERYRLAQALLERLCEEQGAPKGIICTAHTLDDRVETFYMRSLVGTGPGGLASIPRFRGNLRRPLLDAMREQLRDWLRSKHPGVPDTALWREDETNMSGDNFRSSVRLSLIPVLRALRPGFERSLAQTMDLIEDEDAALSQEAESIVYRSLAWDGEIAHVPVSALRSASRPMARRVLRACLLVVNPDARLEAAQIDRILNGMNKTGFATDVSGSIRINSDGEWLTMCCV